MPSSKRQISDTKPHLQRVDDNAFHLHVFRGARSKSNSAVTKRKQASIWRRAIASLLLTNLICYPEILRSHGKSAKKIKKLAILAFIW